MTLTSEILRMRRQKRREELERALQRLISQLQEMGAIRIIVFGSFVKGTLTRWSDLDILVIMPSNKSGKEWFQEIYKGIKVDVGVDILPFTREEIRRKQRESSFIRTILEQGRVVYEKE